MMHGFYRYREQVSQRVLGPMHGDLTNFAQIRESLLGSIAMALAFAFGGVMI